jgi:hypothetical protein
VVPSKPPEQPPQPATIGPPTGRAFSDVRGAAIPVPDPGRAARLPNEGPPSKGGVLLTQTTYTPTYSTDSEYEEINMTGDDQYDEPDRRDAGVSQTDIASAFRDDSSDDE